MTEKKTMDEQSVRELTALATALYRPEAPTASPKNAVPYLVVPDAFHVESLEGLLAHPTAARGTVSVLTLQSFEQFVDVFSGANTRIFVSPACVVAVFDYHGALEPALEPKWGRFRCLFPLGFSSEFLVWSKAADAENPRPFDQPHLAEFVEDNRQDIINPEAAALLEMCRDLEATRQGKFRSGMRLDNGDFRLEIQADTITTMEIPSEIEILIPIFEGCLTADLTVRLRYRADETQGVRFTLWIPGLARIVRKELQALADLVKAATKLPVYMADPPDSCPTAMTRSQQHTPFTATEVAGAGQHAYASARDAVLTQAARSLTR